MTTNKFVKITEDQLPNGTAKIIELDIRTNKICIVKDDDGFIVFPISED